MEKFNKINILGTIYEFKLTKREDDPKLDNNDGYCDSSTKTIVVEDMIPEKYSKANLEEYTKQVVRHEMIHAFLSESGLATCSWADNEEMVDYFAIQLPKMVKAMKLIDVL